MSIPNSQSRSGDVHGLRGWIPTVEADRTEPSAFYGVDRSHVPELPQLRPAIEIATPPSSWHIWRTRIGLFVAPWLERYDD